LVQFQTKSAVTVCPMVSPEVYF